MFGSVLQNQSNKLYIAQNIKLQTTFCVPNLFQSIILQ